MDSLTDDELEEMAFRFIRRGERDAWLERLANLRNRQAWEEFAQQTFIFESYGEPSDAALQAIHAGREQLLVELAENRILPRLVQIRGRDVLQWADPLTGRLLSFARAEQILQTIDTRLRAARQQRGRF